MAKDRGAGKKKAEGRPTSNKRESAATPLFVLNDHTKPVTALAFAPDGQTLVSGSADNTVRLWDATSGKPCPCGVMNEAPWGIAEVAFSPDGRAVVVVSRGVNRPHKGKTRAFHWDLIKRKAVALQAGNAALRGPAFTPDNSLALVGGGIRLFKAGKEIGVMPQNDAGDRIAVSPDGAWAVFGSRQGLLHVLDARERTESHQFQGHTDYVTALAFSPDGRWLVSSSSSHGQEWEPLQEDRSVRLWDFKKRKQLRCWANEWDTTAYLAFLADSRHLISFHDPHGEARLILWSVEGEKPLADWLLPGGGSAIAVWSTVSAAHRTSGRIVTGHADGTIMVWDIAAVLPAPGLDVFGTNEIPSEPARQPSPSPKKPEPGAKPFREEEEDYFSS